MTPRFRAAIILLLLISAGLYAGLLTQPSMSHGMFEQPSFALPPDPMRWLRDAALSPALGLVLLWIVALAVRADARRSLAERQKPARRPVALLNAERQSPGARRTFMLIRAELAIAFGAALVGGYLWIASLDPCMCNPSYQPSLLDRLLPWVGPVGLMVGLLGVVWFSRIDPEPGDRTWRYRES